MQNLMHKFIFFPSSCYWLPVEYEAFIIFFLSREVILASPHVRSMFLISFLNFLRQLALGILGFIFPWEIHLRATLGNLFWWITPNLRWSWARKFDRSCEDIHCEMHSGEMQFLKFNSTTCQLSNLYNNAFLTLF